MQKMTTAQAAQRAKVSRFAIHRATKKGDLNPIRGNDGRFLFDAEDVDAWAAERARTVAQLLPAAKEAEAPHDVAQAAQDAAQAEIEALRERLTDAESRAAQAEARAVVAETRAAVAEAVAAERAERIEDLRLALERPTRRGWWPFGG